MQNVPGVPPFSKSLHVRVCVRVCVYMVHYFVVLLVRFALYLLINQKKRVEKRTMKASRTYHEAEKTYHEAFLSGTFCRREQLLTASCPCAPFRLSL